MDNKNKKWMGLFFFIPMICSLIWSCKFVIQNSQFLECSSNLCRLSLLSNSSLVTFFRISSAFLLVFARSKLCFQVYFLQPISALVKGELSIFFLTRLWSCLLLSKTPLSSITLLLRLDTFPSSSFSFISSSCRWVC